MDYRGSKSEIVSLTKSVKEQRVDGSYCIANSKLMQLRCTLMGGESRYPVKILSKQLNRPLLLNFVGLTLEKKGAKASEGKNIIVQILTLNLLLVELLWIPIL